MAAARPDLTALVVIDVLSTRYNCYRCWLDLRSLWTSLLLLALAMSPCCHMSLVAALQELVIRSAVLFLLLLLLLCLLCSRGHKPQCNCFRARFEQTNGSATHPSLAAARVLEATTRAKVTF